jgi:hypothetical protein
MIAVIHKNVIPILSSRNCIHAEKVDFRSSTCKKPVCKVDNITSEASAFNITKKYLWKKQHMLN